MARQTEHPGARFRRLLDHGGVPIPGAFNGLCARAIADAGFEACYVSGAATTAGAGVPDIGVLSLDRFTLAVREVVDASGLPVLADADTGFGEAEMVRRTVLEYNRAGAAGLHIEDQVFPKRCGHLDGKTLLPLEDAAEKVRWAVRASRDCSGGAFVICARTDARGVDGMDAAVERAAAYTDAGADMIFPEGLQTEREFAIFAKALREAVGRPPHLLANMTEFGKTPIIPLSDFREMGYACVIYPVTTLRIAMAAVEEALTHLRRHGSAEGLLDRMQTRDRLYKLLNYRPGDPWDYPSR